MRRPLIGITLVFMLGTWCGVMSRGTSLSWLPASAVIMLLISFALESISRSGLKRSSSSSTLQFQRLTGFLASLFLYLTILITAWFAAGLRIDNPSGQTLSALMDKPRENMELAGIVCDDPAVRKIANGKRVLWQFPIRLEAIHRTIQWQTARGRVLITLVTDPDSRGPSYGERWRFAGVLKDNARFPSIPGQKRPVQDWIHSRYTFRADPSEAIYLSDANGIALRKWCFKMRRKCAECLARGIEHRPDVTGLLQALLLGYRQELPYELVQKFRVTGTYHIFAISGLHVAILALFIVVLLQSLGISKVHWFYFVAPLLILFTLSTGMRPSTIRGCVMALVCFLGPLVMRKTDIPSAMALAALLILAAAPFELFSYGFILSFSVVTGLIVLCPMFIRYIDRLIEPDPLRIQPEQAPAKLGRRIIRFAVFWVIASTAAWLVSMPLIARWFNLVSPFALLANLFVIPLTSLVLLAGCLSILSGLWFPLLGEIFNFANVVLVSLLISFIGLVARVPHGHFYVQSPPLWSLAVWFGTLFAWVLGKTRIFMLGAVSLAAALLIGIFLSRNQVTMDILNLRKDTVCFVNAPGSDDLLINAGSRFRGRSIVRYLRTCGVDRLRALVLTRADAKHAGGALEVLRNIHVQELWCSSTNMRSKVFRNVMSAARDQGVEIRSLTKNDTGEIKGNLKWKVIHPEQKPAYRSADDALLILIFKRGLASLLLMGKHSKLIESRLPDHKQRLQAEVLVEDRIEQNPYESDENSWLNVVRARWRVLCMESYINDTSPKYLLSDSIEEEQTQNVILGPNMGLRIYFDSHGARIEWLSIE